MTKLTEMFNMQRAFQERLGMDIDNAAPQERAALLRDHYVYLDQELQEALREVPCFKAWKDYSHVTDAESEEAYKKVRMELVDAWHFFMNMMLLAGMTPEELYSMYVAKNAENHRRQDEGYTHDISYADQSVDEVMEASHG